MAAPSSPTAPWPAGLLLLLWLALFPPVLAELQDFAILLPPTDLYVHYADGYVVGPGSIDLSQLTFTAVSEAYSNLDDDADDMNFVDDDAAAAGGGGGNDDRSRSRRRLDGGVELDASYIDIVAFQQPDRCASSRGGCDWTQLGIGGNLPETSGTGSGLRWCCTRDAADGGLCDADDPRQWQRLIVDPEVFRGMRRSITVPRDGSMSKKLRSGFLSLEETGRYVVVFANCNLEGREVMVTGDAAWKSKHGYLPGELFQFMHFYTVLWVGYLLLFVWFARLMRQNEASRIDIEKWIFMTIALGLVEVSLRGVDYRTWNSTGSRMEALAYLGIVLGSMKHGISRSLIVMVSLGWGVIRDSLGSTMKKIVVLGTVYVAVACSRDIVILFAVDDMQTLSYDAEVKLFDAATILTFVVSAIDVIFIMWILDALNGTMQYLENMSQTRKLERYLKLRTIFLFAILFAAIMAVFSMVDTYDEDGIVREEQEWVVEAAGELNYFFVLCGVAMLWKPNPAAKEFAYVMELPASGDGNELELSGTVPSALSDDEDDPVQHDGRFRIEDAEHT